MSYAHFFEKPLSEIDLPPDLVVDMEGLNVEQRAVVLTWVRSSVDQAAAMVKLRELVSHALFDVTAAELGARLQAAGNA